MGIPDSVQTLSAAFSLGILLQAALGALLLYVKGHGSTLLQDRRRLVLVIFLTFSALWAQFDFINLVVPPSLCPGTVIISTTFDQVARVSIEGYLLWSMGHATKSAAEKFGLGGLLGLRFVAGGIFAGFTTVQGAPACVAQSRSVAISATVIGLDVVIIGMILVRILQLGCIGDLRSPRSSTRNAQSVAFTACAAGIVIWTAVGGMSGSTFSSH